MGCADKSERVKNCEICTWKRVDKRRKRYDFKSDTSNTIEGLKGISRIDFCVLDTEGKALATTFEDTWNYESAVLSFVESPADSQVIQGCQFFKIFDEQQLEYVLLAGGESEDVYMLGKIAAFQVQSLLVAYKERFDKDNFIKNLLLDNLLLVDIYNRAKITY